MSCVQYCYGSGSRVRKPKAAKPVLAVAGARRTEFTRDPGRAIAGTWDFKWPIGKVIRVAFQELPRELDGKLMSDGTRLVEEKLNAWLRNPGFLTNLDYKIVGTLPAPKKSEPQEAKSIPGKGEEVVEYDVLISFLPLPVALPPTEQHPEPAPVETSASELGRYAQRIEYGVPTTYLGPWATIDSKKWFEEPVGEFAVVHELGHVLGMAHEQQNPNRPKELDELWLGENDRLARVKNRDGFPPGTPDPQLKEFIKNEIVAKWPHSEKFSDWRATPASRDNGYDFESVMAKPSYQCLLQGNKHVNCTSDGCDTLQQALIALKNPTPGDLAHLVTMYGARARL